MLQNRKGIGSPRFVKGKSGNPLGRGRGHIELVAQLKYAIATMEKKKRKSFFARVVERAWVSDKVLIALLKKLVPDLTHELNTNPMTIINLIKNEGNAEEIKNGQIHNRVIETTDDSVKFS